METEEVMREPCPAAGAAPVAAASAETAGETAEEKAGEPAGEAAAVAEGAVAESGEAAEAPSGMPAAEVERLVEEAYRRGRNESIAELMSAPGLFQPLGGSRQGDEAAPEAGFLANRRPSIWDL